MVCRGGGVAGFLIGIYHAALFKVLIFCVVCAVGVILFAIFSKIVNKITLWQQQNLSPLLNLVHRR